MNIQVDEDEVGARLQAVASAADEGTYDGDPTELAEPGAQTLTVPVSVRLPEGIALKDFALRFSAVIDGAAQFIDEVPVRAYWIVGTPNPPWSVDGGQKQDRPWTAALDVVCEWAEGAATPEEAARIITHAVYALGPHRFSYEQTYGLPGYAVNGQFYLSHFLERLEGGLGRGPFVNCSDCAAAVSSLSNLVGCRLDQSRVEGGFDLNPMQLIGLPTWVPPFAAFNFHEVASTGPCGQHRRVWDGCAALEATANPLANPHTPMVAAGLAFGAPGQGYRHKLATAPHQANCEPTDSIPKHRTLR